MNLLLLMSSIGALLSSLVSPINSDNSTNISNTTECYYYVKAIQLETAKNISNILQKSIQYKQKCEKNTDVCGFTISNRIPSRSFDKIKIGCIAKKRCFMQQPSVWNNYLDYDYPYTLTMHECCQGSLCNTIENSPKIQRVINSKIKNKQAHDKLCPGYSDNYQVIKMQHKKINTVHINEGSNLLLVVHKAEYKIYLNSKISYTGTIWGVSNVNKFYDSIALVSFDTTGEFFDYRQKQNYINKNKIFYVTANTMHICNFTSEAGDLKLQHIDRLQGNEDVISAVNIIVNKSITKAIIPATENTNTLSLDNTTTRKNIGKSIIHNIDIKNTIIIISIIATIIEN